MGRTDVLRALVFRRPGARRVLLVLLLAFAGGASATADLFAKGKARYAQQDYRGAVQAFERAAAADPDVSAYHHWLGKAYGRLAETSGGLAALRLAPKARKAFERAVRLDDTNTAALSDLLDYYESAPAFLGGSEDKAQQVRERLEALDATPGG